MSREVEVESDEKAGGVKRESGEGEEEQGDCYLVEEDEGNKAGSKRRRADQRSREEESEHEGSDKGLSCTSYVCFCLRWRTWVFYGIAYLPKANTIEQL